MENNQMTFFEKICDIQLRLKAPKSQYNSFGKYKYRNCEDILEAVKPLLSEHKLVLSLTDSIEAIQGRFYVKATAIVTDGKNVHKTEAYAREEESKKGMDGSQVTGASSSYARKYALNGMFAIDDTKDSDATNTGDKSQPTEYRCENCGKPFKGLRMSDGTILTAEEVYEKSKAANGKPLCSECRKAGK